MLKILKYLITIRFRKIFAKDDFFAIGLLVIVITVLSYFFNLNYNKNVNYLGFFVLIIIGIQIDRKDIELLKLNKNYRIILFLEYCILSFPVLILLAFNAKIFYFSGFLISLFAITFLRSKSSRVIKYPFKMFDVFWTISFRKYNFILLIPVLMFVIFMGYKYPNPNLQYSVLLVIGIVLCVPTSEREKIYFIKASSFIGKDYLWQQIKTILYNSIFVLIPIAIVFLVLQEFQILFFIPLILLFPIVNLLFKYVFFDRIIVHNIFFATFLGFLVYGFPLLFIPLLYLKSVKNLKIIQNV